MTIESSPLTNLKLLRGIATDYHNHHIFNSLPLPENFNSELYIFNREIDSLLNRDDPSTIRPTDIESLTNCGLFVHISTTSLSTENVDNLRNNRLELVNRALPTSFGALFKKRPPKTVTPSPPKSVILNNIITSNIMNKVPAEKTIHTKNEQSTSKKPTNSEPQEGDSTNLDDYFSYGGSDDAGGTPPQWTTESIN